MALSIQSTLVAINTSGTTQDITITSFGTVKAAMFVWQRSASGDDHASNLAFSIGFFDGTRNRCWGISSDDASASSDTDRTQSDVSCGVLLNPGAATVDGEFSGNSFITDGVRINLDNFAGAAYLCQVTLFGGTDISNIRCDHHDDLGTGTLAVPITAPGFQADLVFCVHTGDNTAITGTDITNTGLFDFGVWARVDNTQRFNGFATRNNRGTMEVASYPDSTHGTGQIIWTQTVSWVGTFGANANGFEVTPGSNAGNDIIGYLAIEFGVAPDLEIVGSSMPASGDWVESGFTFQPDFGICSFVAATTDDTVDDAGEQSFSVHTIESGQVLSAGLADESDAADSITASWGKSTFFIGDSDGTTVADEGTLQSIDSNGWTIDLGGGTNDGVQRKGWSLAIKAGAAAAAAVMNQLQQSNVGADLYDGTLQ